MADQGRHLLDLALAQPGRALAEAAEVLASRRDPELRSYAHHATGIVLRDRDDVRGSLRALRAALRLAESHALPDRAAQVRGTLGTTLMIAGRPRQALDVFTRALDGAEDLTAARVRMLRAAVREQYLDQDDGVAADYAAALATFRRAGEPALLARTLLNRAESRWRRGHPAEAEDDLREAERSLVGIEEYATAALARASRAELAQLRGDLPATLRHLDRAEALLRAAGEDVGPLVLGFRCRTLLLAGLYAEAVEAAESGLRRLGSGGAAPRALLSRDGAEAALQVGDTDRSVELARTAQRIARRMGNTTELARAQLLELRARAVAGERAPALLRRAAALAGDPCLDAADAAEANLLAGRLALQDGRVQPARRHLRTAALARRRGTPLLHSRGWLAAALEAEAAGRPRRVLHCCARGLDVLGEHLATLGAAEMRAAATSHGSELARLGLRHAVRSGDPRSVLTWSERWRATTIGTAVPDRDVRDPARDAELGRLRQVVAELREAQAEGRPTATLERTRRTLERTVRQASLGRSGGVGSAPRDLDPRALADALGDAALVEIGGVDDVVHVVTVCGGRTRLHLTSSIASAQARTEQALFPLRAVAAGGPGARHMVQPLEQSLEAVQDALLATVLDDLDAERVVVVPPSRLHSLPWSALPGLRQRTVSVAPSATSWLQSATRPEPQRHRTVLVGAPGLASGAAEVRGLAAVHPAATVLQDGAATADAVLAALDGAWLGHVAAHGTFRGDNPLFSALEMADGPLTVYDLERLRSAPYRLVLSACESAVNRPTGADELLGVAAVLLGLGTAGLLASVVPVDDAATARLSIAVHRRLAAGDDLPTALRWARTQAVEPVDVGVASAFLALGAM